MNPAESLIGKEKAPAALKKIVVFYDPAYGMFEARAYVNPICCMSGYGDSPRSAIGGLLIAYQGQFDIEVEIVADGEEAKLKGGS